MPRSLDPNARLTIVLACDVDKVPQPKIYAKMPTLNQQRKLIGLMGSMQGSDVTAKVDAIIDAAMTCLSGWENIPMEFNRDNIGEVLSLEELLEVFGFLVSATMPTADDKKKSELQP
ncbi:MAG: hypothetical protein ACKO0Z_24465 [Betaproteobacteria bacterium]